MKTKIKEKLTNKYIFAIVILLFALIIIPICFNFLFIWDSGFSNGKTSDWFVFYGGIFGGLIGGFFTYLALLLTLNNQRDQKVKEMRPRIDIPFQSMTFSSKKDDNDRIAIELNNIGGTLAKNLECKLSIMNYDEIRSGFKNNTGGFMVGSNEEDVYFNLWKTVEGGLRGDYVGHFCKEYDDVFIGSCVPLALDYKAKSTYLLNDDVSEWINRLGGLGEKIVTMNLEIKYSSLEFGDFTDNFKLEWNCISNNATLKSDRLIYNFVLKSTLDKR